MLTANNINQEEMQLPISDSGQQLDNEYQNTIEDGANQVRVHNDSSDHLMIQMANFDQNEQTLKENSQKEESQHQEGVKDSLFQNQNDDHFLEINDQSKMGNEQYNQKMNRKPLQLAIENQDVQLQIINQRDVEDQMVREKEVTLIQFDDDPEENKNDKEQKQQSFQHIESLNLKQNQEDINQQVDLDTICPICSSNLEKIVRLLECEHQFCESCYKEYLEDKIKIAKINNIQCLQDGCTVIFSEEIIQKLVSEQKFKQYVVFKRKYEIENDPNKKWCPGKGCDLYIEKDPKTNLIQCQCGILVCFNCGQIAHQGLLCEDAIQSDFKQALTKYLIKYCPNCKSHIQKNAGCNHMTCIQCQFQFCWICLQPYHEYHYRYWSIKGCAIWSNGRFKTSQLIENPDKMRRIYFAPRLFLYLIRGPLLIVKLTLKAACKSIVKPFTGLNKKMCRSSKPKFCLLKCCYYLLAELLILLIVILIFPFYFVFYRFGKEVQWLSIKGCAY